jgi:hypothetical protein
MKAPKKNRIPTQTPTYVYRQMGVVVKDSYTDLSVEATPADIEGATCRDHQNCVIARAILRESKGVWVDVGSQVVLIGIDKKQAKRYILNRMAQKQVRYFDTHSGKAAPCRVHLKAPSKAVRLGYRSGEKNRRGKHSNRRSLKRTPPTR